MLMGKIADVFSKEKLGTKYPVQIFNIVWLGVVIRVELISSNLKVIATCADSNIMTFSSVANV